MTWMDQVVNMPNLWESVGNRIDRTHFTKMFVGECKELGLPYQTYDMDDAFNKANGEWAEELIVATATYILKWYFEVDEDLYLPDGVVELKEDCIIVKDNLYQMVEAYLEEHPNHPSKSYLVSLMDVFQGGARTHHDMTS